MTAPDPVMWVTPDDVAVILGDKAPAEDDVAGQARLEQAIQSATEILYALSGRQFPGLVQAFVRPTARPEQVTDHIWGNVMRRLTGWGWGYSSTWMWGSTGNCSPYMIALGRKPIVSVERVIIDGDIVDPTTYRVDDQLWLVRECDGCCGWPTCQDMSAPIGDSCTFGVDFTFGQAPPTSGEIACSILSAEYYKATTPELQSACALPKRVSMVVRQGVTIGVLDPMSYLEKGKTGLASVDMFITSYNPKGWVRKPMVYSPDLVQIGRYPTWPVVREP